MFFLSVFRCLSTPSPPHRPLISFLFYFLLFVGFVLFLFHFLNLLLPFTIVKNSITPPLSPLTRAGYLLNRNSGGLSSDFLSASIHPSVRTPYNDRAKQSTRDDVDDDDNANIG